MKVYFNPNCSKCRNAVAQLDESKTDYELVKYLDEQLSAQELRDILDKLSDPIEDLVRKDRNFQELGLNADDYSSKDAIVDLLVKHPELMQRPIILKEGQAHIARSEEKVSELIS